MYIYLSILLMAVVTYFIRLLPLVLFRKPISNKFVRSFLYYAPYVTISVLTFPAILSCTGNYLTSCIGFAVAVIITFITGNFVISTFASCMIVFILQLIL